jgi:hypothetical protein
MKPLSIVLVLLVLGLALSSCSVSRGLIDHPDAASAPDGCAWVVRDGAPWWRSVALCCAVPPEYEPVCREAAWQEASR